MLEPIHQTQEKFDEICSWCPMPPKLIGEKVFLTALDPECTDEILRFMTDETVATGFGGPLYKAFTHEEEYGLIGTKECNVDSGFNFMMWDIEDQCVIGICCLNDVKMIHRTASVGIAIGLHEYRGGGRGTEALNLMLKFAFQELDLFEVCLGVYEFNDVAIKCYNKCGFKEYGRRRKSRYVHGQRYDEVLMDILKDEWKALHNAELGG